MAPTPRPRSDAAAWPPLPQIAARLYGTPLLLTPAKAQAIADVLGPRLAGKDAAPLPRGLFWDDDEADDEQAPYEMTAEGIAVISVMGPLVRRGSWLGAMCGVRSYSALQEDVAAALADPAVKGIMLDLDTPGGEAAGCFDTADAIRGAAKAARKPVWAIANDMAASAGYVLGSVADRLWLTRTGEVGSIGVVALHRDQSKADAEAGLAYTYVYAGEHKVDGHPHAPLSRSAKAEIQRGIDGVYALFVDHVARYRGLTPEAVRDIEARVYLGADALAVGLADAVGAREDALAAFARTLNRSTGTPFPPGGRSALNPQTEDRATMSNGALNPALEETPEDQIEGGAPVSDDAAPEAEDGGTTAPEASASPSATISVAQAARIVELAEQARKLGVSFDAAKAIKEGADPAALQGEILGKLAAKADADPIVSAHATRPEATPKKAKSEGWNRALTRSRK